MRQYNKIPKERWQALCQRPVMAAPALDALANEVFQSVNTVGDEALRKYTKRFDGIDLAEAIVPPDTVAAWAQPTAALRQAIDEAYSNIRAFHRLQRPSSPRETVLNADGRYCWQETRPIERVGLYVPGGSAPLVSTALMLGVPAQLAGCKEIVLVTPPNRAGTIESAICYAAQKIGATQVVRAGGMQAIAALTFGTATISPVDKIFGPGNQYVTFAKQYAQNFGVAIDMPAGPSEVMVLADAQANAAFVAADLLSQAEHGPDSQVVLVTTTASLATAVQEQLKLQLATLPRKAITEQALSNSFCLVVDSLAEAISFANCYAPEHLIVNTRRPSTLLSSIKNAGSVFVGEYSPESAGDYASGTNHTLPTNGWARSYGGVSLESFTKKITFQELTASGLAALANTIETLARAEGLEAHARAVSIRCDQERNKR